VEHVSDSFKLGYLLPLSSILLVGLGLLFRVEFIDQVLVLIHVILGHFEQIQVYLLVSGFFPPHKSNTKAAFVLIDEAKLKSLQHLLLENDSVFPQQQRFVSMVAMSQVTLAQNVHFSLLSRVFDQALFTVLQLLLLRDLVIENVTGFLVLRLNVAKPDRIEGLLHQSFGPDCVNFVDKLLFLVKVLVFARSFAPVLPLGKLAASVLSLLLLASVL
jgi:hypothetical protein